MTERIYEYPVIEQFDLTLHLSPEALAYFDTIEDDDEDAIRHLMRYFLVPVYRSRSPRVQEHARRAILWFIHCATDDDRIWLLGQPAFDWPTGGPHPPRRFFELWWLELFGEEPPEPGDLCDAEYRHGAYPPDWKQWGHNPLPELDRAVFLFPRRDGLPPGHGAPETLRKERTLRPPTRPTDAARFLRWEDQAEAIQQAQDIHAQTGQHKVWVEFRHIIGEGYFVGGEEYVETNWACVRFRDAGPVDSWPDLRKAWLG